MRLYWYMALMLCQPLSATVSLSKFGPGQFGNDCFRLAAVIALAKENQCPLGLPDYHGYFSRSPEILDYYDAVYQRIAEVMPLKIAYAPSFYEYFPSVADILEQCQSLERFITEEMLPKKPANPYTKNHHDFAPGYRPIPYEPGIEIQGYFQSEQYFKTHKSLICQLFKPSEAIESYLHKHFGEILSHPKTVGLHVRTYYRDWLNEEKDPNFYTQWLAPDLEFYQRAMELFDQDTLFVVCSDYPEWCKENFKAFNRHCIFIKNHQFIYDFFLLTKCRDMIVMGSTFGWWAAYLNENPEKRVIYRNPFYAVDGDFGVAEWFPIDIGALPPPPIFP